MLPGCKKQTDDSLSKYEILVPVDIIKARITEVNVRQNDVIFIKLDVGKGDGVLMKMRFEIVRHGETMGELIIIEVGKDFSTGQIIRKQGDFIVGDRAVTRERARRDQTNTGDRKDSE